MYEKERRLVAAGSAKITNIRSVPLLNTEELTLFWPIDDLKLAKECKVFLDKYTSTLNYNEGGPSTTIVRFVKNPVATIEEATGTWRLISNSLTQHKDMPGILQVLRKGYLSVLPIRESLDDECLLADDKINPINHKRTITRYWFGINPDYEMTIMNGLKAISLITDPRIRSKTYTGLFAVSAVWPVIEPGTGDMSIYQTLTEVVLIDDITDLTGLTATKTRENEILDPFGIVSGEEDVYAFVYTNIARTSKDYLIGIPDADLVTNLANSDAAAWLTATAYTVGKVVTEAGSMYICWVAHTSGTFATDLAAGKWDTFGSWTYVDRKYEDVADNTGKFTVIFKNERWLAWGHGSYAADTTSYGDAGTANERENITKIWTKIRKADLATAISNCRTGTNVAAESGYIITDAKVTDNQNGSITLTQIQIKQINDKDEVGAEVFNPHGIWQGLGATTRTIFENFTYATLPAGDTVAINTNVISSVPEIMGNGLWRRIVITKAVTWAKTWSDAVKMSESNVGGYQISEDREVGGVSQANADTAFTAAKTAGGTAATLVVMTRLMEKANGERMIGNMQRKITNTPTAVGADTPDTVVAESVQINREPASCVRVWWRRTLAAKNYLVAVGGGARLGFTYNAVAFTHHSIRISDNGDGSYDVYQTATGGQFFTVGRFDNTGEIIEQVYEDFVRITPGYLTYSLVLVTVWRKAFDTAQEAATYSALGGFSQSEAEKEAGAMSRRPPNGVTYAGSGKWWGRKVEMHVQATNASWTLAASPAASTPPAA